MSLEEQNHLHLIATFASTPCIDCAGNVALNESEVFFENKVRKVRTRTTRDHMDVALYKSRKRLPNLSDLSNSSRRCSRTNQKDLICTVCGSPATGFNFGVITCMCCKAFFRRNALFGLPSLQCRYLSENCSIDLQTRRDCSFCRLKKCFDVGMRKDLILTDELKQVKRQKILANRQSTLNSIHPIDSLHIKRSFQLKDTDLQFLTNIYNAYEEYCRLPSINYDKSECDLLLHQPLKSRVKLSNYFEYYTQVKTFLLNFFQRLPEYKSLSSSEQQALIERNVRPTLRLSCVETLRDNLPVWPAVHLIVQTIFGPSLTEDFANIFHGLKDQIGDPVCIRLVVIILFFSITRPSLDYLDSLKLYRIQEKYIELLWCYLKQRYSERTACHYLVLINRHCLQLLTIGHVADKRRLEICQQNSFLSLNDSINN